MSASPIRLTVYSKDECHLCDQLLEVVEKVRSEQPFELEVVDIAEDPALKAKYGHEIPVVMINGRKAIKFRTTEAELKKKLKLARERSHSSSEEPSGSDPLPGGPPAPAKALLLGLALVGASVFIARGIEHASRGEERLAARLLDVKERDQDTVPFRLRSLDGKEVSLADFSGKVVFLNFWATWCPPCVEEMPSMMRLYEKLRSKPNFVFLAVSSDDGWDPVRKFFGSGPPPFTVLLDARGEIAQRYGTTQFPETYVLVDGRVRAFIEGPRDWDTWFAEAYFDRLTARVSGQAIASRER
jgi:thiol-disulfide isomerase/thioredoxin